MVSVVGSSLHIDAAYFTDAVYATPMTVLSLDFVPGAEKEEDVKLARQFQVLRNAVNRLAQFYGNNHIGPYVEKKEIRIGAPDFLLPAPCVVPETGDTWTPLHQFQDFSLKFTDACFTTHGRAVFKGRITRPSSIVATPMSPLTPLPLSNPSSQEPSLPLLLPSPLAIPPLSISSSSGTTAKSSTLPSSTSSWPQHCIGLEGCMVALSWSSWKP